MITEILRDEYWWGGNVHDGADMPYHSKSSAKIDLRCPSPNQSASLFCPPRADIFTVRSRFCIQFENGIIKRTARGCMLPEVPLKMRILPL